MIRAQYPANPYPVLAEDAKADAIMARGAYAALVIDKNECAAGLKAQSAE